MAKSRIQNPFLPDPSAVADRIKLQSGMPCGDVRTQEKKHVKKIGKKPLVIRSGKRGK